MRITHFIRAIAFFTLIFGPVMLSLPSPAFAQIAVAITVAPPPLPVYEQPPCPGDDYIWTPGYWAWDDDDYYWVPGTWVLAPGIGLFWTPGYWAWGGSSFVFYQGYWGPVVGFYGGINYGYGYFGHGYEGGRWQQGHFFYNRSVNNLSVTEVHNVYNTTVINNSTLTRVSYNGGNGGINERPTSQEEAAARERHIPPVAAQVQHAQTARTDRELRASANHGKPPIAATMRPAAFTGHGVVAAKEGGHYTPPARPANNPPRPGKAIHPNDFPPATRPPSPNTGNPKVDRKYQQQQDKLYAQQQKELQKLQQKQERDHQRLAQQKADESKRQQVEQRHQQQTQQLAQKHSQQQQKMEEQHQQPHSNPPKQQKNKT
jgi:hypothetical protein